MSILPDFDPWACLREQGREAVATVATVAGVQGAARDDQPMDLPPDIAWGLMRLATMRAPRISQPAVWQVVLRDAVRLERDGWIRQALALGWRTGDLFGYRTADPWRECLTVWLAGRELVLLTDQWAMARDGAHRSMFYRVHDAPCDRMLWEL